jgi:DnaK suppressor protein
MATAPGSSATPRTDIDFEYFRKRLLEEKATAESIVDDDVITVARTGADTNMPTDEEDTRSMNAGTDLTMRGQNQALVANARQILSRIERAMQKLNEGTYGLSDVSGKPIPVERLEAIPYALMTADEQEKYGI